MEHIINFAISVEDERIVKSIEKNVEQNVTNAIRAKVEDIICNRYRYRDEKEPLKNMINECIRNVLEENKDYILENAYKTLADRLLRSKAGKELLERVDV